MDAKTIQQKRISRKITLDAHQPVVNIRPVIKKADTEAADTLTEAFKDNPIFNWLCGSVENEKKRMDIFRSLFKVLIRAAAGNSRENALQLNGCKGVMIWTDGNADPLTLKSAVGMRKVWKLYGGFSAATAAFIHHRHLMKMKKRILHDTPHLHVYHIGVLPSEQRRHIGSALLRKVMQKADEAQLHIFAEVWTKDNLPWLEQHGFKLHSQALINNDPNLCVYYVVRPPLPTEQDASSIRSLHLEPPRQDQIAEPST